MIYVYMSGGQNSYPVSLTVRNVLTVAYETLTFAYGKLLTATRERVPHWILISAHMYMTNRKKRKLL